MKSVVSLLFCLRLHVVLLTCLVVYGVLLALVVVVWCFACAYGCPREQLPPLQAKQSHLTLRHHISVTPAPF